MLQALSNNNEQLSIYSLSHIEQQVDYDTFLYIIRRINRIIKCSFQRDETARQLRNRLKEFDDDCELNGQLANIPVDQLFDELGDAELKYCLCDEVIV